jgi:L-rhamnonate dehydratase
VKLLLGEDPFNVERIWDILWRSTMYYGRSGAVIHAISGVDLAVWDLIGRALAMPVYRLLGGETKARIPCYCTGNDVEQHVAFGYKRLKLAIPHGPADGREGMKKNLELVRRTRELLGADGDIMLDCWMAWDERYTLEMAELLAPYRIYWMEECLQPHDYEGFGRLHAAIKSTRIVTGEHEYTRYGFRQLLSHGVTTIWQPDIQWCGGLTELRRIGALAAAYDVAVIPHGGGSFDSVHWIMAAVNSPWAELFMPAPGGPPEVYRRHEEDNQLTRGPEGIYMRPSDRPGLGWDIEVARETRFQPRASRGGRSHRSCCWRSPRRSTPARRRARRLRLRAQPTRSAGSRSSARAVTARGGRGATAAPRSSPTATCAAGPRTRSGT